MQKKDKLIHYLSNFQKNSNRIFISSDVSGYWSNLSKIENDKLISMLGSYPTRECIYASFPNLMEIIFSDKRSAALELLQLSGSEVAVDFGCMWGALTIPLAKQVSHVLGIDQTIESLKFSEARANEEGLDNINFLCGNLRSLTLPKDTFDIAIVNGVLEWIPEMESIIVKDYWNNAKKRSVFGNPGDLQKEFLKNIYSSLQNEGRLMLAIENRYDYKMFLGIRDPHTGTFFTTIAPRWLANLISLVIRKREYRPWIYSFSELEKLLKDVGFSAVKLHACWPDYRFPNYINEYGNKNFYSPGIFEHVNTKNGFKKWIGNAVEFIIFKIFNLQFFAPSIIAVAVK